MYEGPFSVESTVRVVIERAVTNLAAAPTAYRMLMAAGETAMKSIAGRLRVASSGGEPLNPEVARWAERVLNCPLHDHYGQTEMAMLVNNHHGLRHAVKAGFSRATNARLRSRSARRHAQPGAAQYVGCSSGPSHAFATVHLCRLLAGRDPKLTG